MVANWKQGQRAQAMEQFSSRWIKAKKVNGYTLNLYHAWQSAGHPTVGERWLRLDHYAQRSQWKKIKGEKRHLSKTQQPLVDYWQKMQRNPEKMFAQWPDKIDPVPAGLILKDGLNRLSRSSPARAWLQLQQLVSKMDISAEETDTLKRKIALRAAKQHKVEAITWLNSLSKSAHTEETRGWLTRLLMINQRWEDTVVAIDAMPAGERKQSKWLYWKARALEMTGNRQLSEPLYLLLADERGYYSFLASERLGLPLRLESQSLEAPAEAIVKVSTMRPIQRAYEWL